MSKTKVRLDAISMNAGAQSREATNQAVVDEYAALMGEGVEFPPVKLIRLDDSGLLIPFDGWHRILAAKKNGFVDIEAMVRSGDSHDVVLASASANADHGLPRSAADRRRCAVMVLQDEKWRARTDTWIAKEIGVPQTTVTKIRHELEEGGNSKTLTRQTEDGKTINVEGRGRKKREPAPEAQTPQQEPTVAPTLPQNAPVNDVAPEPKAEAEEVLAPPSAVTEKHIAQSAPRGYTAISTAVMGLTVEQLESLHILIGNLIRARKAG